MSPQTRMSALAALVDGSPVTRNLIRHQSCAPLQVVRGVEGKGGEDRAIKSGIVASEPRAVDDTADAIEHDVSQHALLFHGAAAYGKQLLSCRSREELEEKLDELLADPAFLTYLTYLKETGSQEASALDEDAFVKLYRYFAGGRGDAKVRALAEMAVAGSDATRHVSPFMRRPKRHHATMTDRLEDISTPVEYTDAIQSGMRAAACELALFGAFDGAASSLSDAQLETLLDVACDNQRAWLRLIAGLPGAEVPGHIVPASQRLDWNALMDRWDILAEQVTRYERAALASPDGAYTPFDEPHRERD